MTAVICGVLFFISALLYLSVLMGKSKSCGGRGGSLYLGQFNFRLNGRIVDRGEITQRIASLAWRGIGRRIYRRKLR